MVGGGYASSAVRLGMGGWPLSFCSRCLPLHLLGCALLCTPHMHPTPIIPLCAPPCQVGVTAMLISSKYEEIWAPEVRDFVYISDRAYTKEQILGMEKVMLNTLRFQLTLPTVYNFLARDLKAANMHFDKDVTMLASYVVELAQVDPGMLRHSYSLVAVASLHVAMASYGKADAYPKALAKHSGYSLEEVRPIAAALVELMAKAPTNSLNAVYKKYSSQKYNEAAKRPPPAPLAEPAAA